VQIPQGENLGNLQQSWMLPQLQMDTNIDGSELPFVVRMINQMFFPE
jgi:hypothetical protein